MEFSIEYIKDVYQEARQIVKECCPDFTDPIITFKPSKARSYWAYVEKKGSNYFWIRVSDVFAEITDCSVRKEKLLETIIHELVHTIPKCMNHKTYWKANCSKVRIKYPRFKLDVTDDMSGFGISEKVRDDKYIITCQHCGHKWNYKRKPKWINRADMCRCPYCNNKGMEVTAIEQ
jgi:DNA-directed RNA polymerase subunit RPC12/RpoP